MKWARKKSSSLINRVFPVSWFNKFKRKSCDHDRNSATCSNTKKSVLDFPSPSSPPLHRDGRFYSMDEDDAYWRISFGDQPRRSTGGINPLWRDSDHHDLEDSIYSDFKRLGLAEEAEAPTRNFSEMVSDIKKMREMREKEKEKAKLQINIDREKDSQPDPHSCKYNIVGAPDHRELKGLKMMKIGERKSRESSSRRPRGAISVSPRTECKIRALEKVKKKKKKMKMKSSVFDSFAVAKSSNDPRRDFKDSMVEMIMEKGIGHPDDLEQLLACYLTLNCDEYHDLIITVFRQVWIELKGAYIHPIFIKNVSYFD